MTSDIVTIEQNSNLIVVSDSVGNSATAPKVDGTPNITIPEPQPNYKYLSSINQFSRFREFADLVPGDRVQFRIYETYGNYRTALVLYTAPGFILLEHTNPSGKQALKSINYSKLDKADKQACDVSFTIRNLTHQDLPLQVLEKMAKDNIMWYGVTRSDKVMPQPKELYAIKLAKAKKKKPTGLTQEVKETQEAKDNEKEKELFFKKFPDMESWLKPLTRFNGFIKYDSIGRITLTTKHYTYSITMDIPEEGKSYLGCIASLRFPLPGETHLRGNDLADGEFSIDTWAEILVDILAYELVNYEEIHQKV